MFGFQTFTVRKDERALLLRDGDFERLLTPGQYRLFDPTGKYDVQRFAVAQTLFSHALADYFLAHEPELVEREFAVARIAEHEAGLLFEDDLLVAVLPPGTRRLYWKSLRAVRVETLDLRETLRLPDELLRRMTHSGLRAQAVRGLDGVAAVEVPHGHIGLLYVDGSLREALQPGTYGFWQYFHTVTVTCVDLRAQNVDISGQEILTRDKVSLRINLSAVWRYADALRAYSELAVPHEHLYRELQFALRAAIGTRTLDALLEDKSALDSVIAAAAAPTLAAHGIALESVGVKDIILPGEMKTLLAQVVEAEKAAQANVIRRREETAATRSLLNTAKVMEDSPLALRMKELETLERVVERIDNLQVVGGLEQVMNGLVKLRG